MKIPRFINWRRYPTRETFRETVFIPSENKSAYKEQYKVDIAIYDSETKGLYVIANDRVMTYWRDIEKGWFRGAPVEKNLKLIVHFKLHKTRKKKHSGTWIEIEASAETVITRDKESEANTIMDDMVYHLQEIIAVGKGDFWGMGTNQFSGVNASNLEEQKERPEETDDINNYPTMNWEILLKNNQNEDGRLFRGTDRL